MQSDVTQRVKEHPPLEIGLTGGIGAGKSLVGKIFSSFQVPIYNSDDRAKILINTELKLIKQIEREFNISPCNQDGNLNKKILRTFFAHPNRLKRLNAVVHPWVMNDYEKWKAKQKKKPYTVKEAALLIEAGTASNLDKLIVVTAPTALRIKRVLARDPYRTKQDVQNIMKNQMSEQSRVRQADYVICNDETRLLIPQVWELHQLFTQMDYPFDKRK